MVVTVDDGFSIAVFSAANFATGAKPTPVLLLAKHCSACYINNMAASKNLSASQRFAAEL